MIYTISKKKAFVAFYLLFFKIPLFCVKKEIRQKIVEKAQMIAGQRRQARRIRKTPTKKPTKTFQKKSKHH